MKVVRKLRYKIKRLYRALEFAMFSLQTYDWDFAYLHKTQAFVLKRLERALKRGYGVQEPIHMKALTEAIKINTRLYEANYELKYINAYNKKWKPKRKFVPVAYNGEKYSQLKSTYNVKTVLDEKKRVKDLFQIDKLAIRDRNADLNRLNQIFKKHSHYWWD